MNARTARDLRRAARALQPVLRTGKDGTTAHRALRELKRAWMLVPWTRRHALRTWLAAGHLTSAQKEQHNGAVRITLP